MSNRYESILKKKKNANRKTYRTIYSNSNSCHLEFLTEYFKKPDNKILRNEKEVIDLIPFVKKVFKDNIEEIDYGWKNNRLMIFIQFKKKFNPYYPVMQVANFMKDYELETPEDFIAYINTVDNEYTLEIKKIIEKMVRREEHNKKYMKIKGIKKGY